MESNAVPRPRRAAIAAAALLTIAVPARAQPKPGAAPLPPAAAQPPSTAAPPPAAPPQAVVQSFYRRYQSGTAAAPAGWNPQDAGRYFSDRLARLVIAAGAAGNPPQGAGCGALAPFAGTPNPAMADLHVRIEHLSPDPKNAVAVATYGRGAGETTVLLALVDTGAGWRIDDIGLRPGRSLRRHIEQCAATAAIHPARRPGYRSYASARFGYSLTYPSSFAPDPASLAPDGSGASFYTADRSAQFTVSAGPAAADEALADLFAAARRDLRRTGRVTYAQKGRDWFVVSGLVHGRIYYQRTVLSAACATTGTLVVEYPAARRRRLDRAVAVMSHSFRAAGPPCKGTPKS